MPKRKIHFIGFLANVDNSILKIKLKNDFEVKKLTEQEVRPLLRKIEFHYGVDTGFQMLEFQTDGRPSGSYCITKQSVAEFEGTTQGGVVIKPGELKRFVSLLRDRIRLLRLFKEGNIVLWHSCFYYMKNTEPSFISIHSEGPIADKTKFKLENIEIADVQHFIENTKLPFREKFLQLAFESFELSYEIHDVNLAFISLMISMETLFNRSDRELRYRISRNTAVLLGENHKKSEDIFKDIKNLYDRRSEVVHGLTNKKTTKNIREEELLRLRNYVRESIKEIERTGKNKSDLLETLNSRGFGQRTWKQNE